MLGTPRLRRPFLALLAAAPLVASLFVVGPPASATPSGAAPSGPWTVRWASQPSAAAPPSAGNAVSPTISADGRQVTFTSSSRLNGDGSLFPHPDDHAFVSRVDSPRPRRLAVTSDGRWGNGTDTSCNYCVWPLPLTADAGAALFTSASSNLTPGDTNHVSDVFRRDLRTGAVRLVSHAPDGSPANGASSAGQMSADGRWVLYSSGATNLTSAPPAPGNPPYLYDASTDRSRQLDVVDWRLVDYAVLSSSGAKLLIVTRWNLLPEDDANGNPDTYVVDLATGALSLASVSSAGKPLHGEHPSISDDDTTISFTYYDRKTAGYQLAVRYLGTGRTVTVPGSHGVELARLSGDGRRLATLRRLTPPGSPLVLEVTDLAGLVLYRSAPSVSQTMPSIDRDGSCVAFETYGAELAADANDAPDVYTACQG